MPDQTSHAHPLWVIIVLALLTSTVPSYMSYLASKQTIEERGKDVGVASVDRTRDILEPVIVDLSRRVGEIGGRLDAMQGSAGSAPVAVAPLARPPQAAAESSDTSSPAPARRGGLSASTPRADIAPVLPKRPQLTPTQRQLSRELSQAY